MSQPSKTPPLHRFLKPGDGHGNVVFNFQGDHISRQIDDLAAFAVGYHEQGKALVAQFGQDGGYADYEGYPILFLYRHALELFMKAVVYRGADVLGLVHDKEIDTTKLFYKHDLSPLLPHVRAIWEAQDWDFEGTGLESFADFEDLVRSIDSIDAGSYAFRYPMNKSGQAHLPHHFVINIFDFARGLNGLLDTLHGAVSVLKEEFQLEAEQRYRLQEFVEEHEEG